MRKLWIAGIVLALGGCASWSDMKDGVEGLKGQPIDNAIAKLGYPTAEQTIAGRKLYRWRTASQGAIAMPTSATTTGTMGAGLNAVNYTSRTNGMALEPVSYQCEIILEVDKGEIVRKYQYEGNFGGCEPYIRALKK